MKNKRFPDSYSVIEMLQQYLKVCLLDCSLTICESVFFFAKIYGYSHYFSNSTSIMLSKLVYWNLLTVIYIYNFFLVLTTDSLYKPYEIYIRS